MEDARFRIENFRHIWSNSANLFEFAQDFAIMSKPAGDIGMTETDSNRSGIAGIVIVQAALFVIAWGGLKWTGLETDILWGGAWIDAILGLGAGCLSYLLLLGITRSKSSAGRALSKSAEAIRPTVAGLGYGAIVIVAFAAAIGEEFLFRVFLQSWLTSLATPWIGVAAGALAFALAHLSSLTHAILSFVLGLAIGAVFAWTGSILLIVCWHFSYDLLALLILVKSPEILEGPTSI
jgi:membrane protease YdiL (CAAX protease family)